MRKAQETAFALAAINNSKAEDDDTVRSKLKGLRSQWKVFAKDWAAKHWSDINERPEINQLLAGLVEADERQSPDGLWASQNMGKAPSILLNAELARFLAREIILQPFTSTFAYSSEVNADVDNPCATMDTLNKLYKLDTLGKFDNGTLATDRHPTCS